MTAAQPSPVMAAVRDGTQTVASVLVVIGSLYLGIAWFTGGMKPQSQIAADELRAQVGDLQKTLTEIKARLDTLPRPSDYTEIQAHLARIDTTFGVIADRFARNEASSAATAATVQRLIDGSSQPLRIPKN